MSSCDKESQSELFDEPSRQKLEDSDLKIGETYRMDQMSENFLEEMDFKNISHKRSIWYRVRWESDNPGDCNIPHIISPWNNSTSLEGVYVWAAGPTFNGTWALDWVDNSGSCSSSILDRPRVKVYEVDGGSFTPISNTPFPYDPSSGLSAGVMGYISTSDGGKTWTIVSMP